jgi:hypothetical protein
MDKKVSVPVLECPLACMCGAVVSQGGRGSGGSRRGDEVACEDDVT